MASVVNKLAEQNLISPPKWLPNNTLFEGLTGSVAYGASDDTSDMDVVGFCMPPKGLVFPHTTGQILGFGSQVQRFEQYQQHRIIPNTYKEFLSRENLPENLTLMEIDAELKKRGLI